LPGNDTTVFRILDANCNRLREALRVIEEYFRFIRNEEEPSAELKLLRHELSAVEQGIGRSLLLDGRNTGEDCFADETRPEELTRSTVEDVAGANFKRGQEAARVIEEYVKISGHPHLATTVKKIRFALYTIEKRYSSR
jgi:hypothetical protein